MQNNDGFGTAGTNDGIRASVVVDTAWDAWAEDVVGIATETLVEEWVLIGAAVGWVETLVKE